MILQAVPAAEQKLLQSERVDSAPLFPPGGGGGAFTPLLPALRQRSQNRAQPRQTCEHQLAFLCTCCGSGSRSVPMFLGLPDPYPLDRDMDPDSSIIKQN